MAADFIQLDRVLAHYGPESKEARDSLRSAVDRMLDSLWPKDGRLHSQSEPTGAGGEGLYDQIQELAPKTDAQRSLQSQALSIAIQLGEARWLMYAQAGSFISLPVLMLVVFWLAMIF